jgi:Enoyl-(Acyl carrier protein) reductase
MPVVRNPVSTETAVQSWVFGGWTQSFARTRGRSQAHRKDGDRTHCGSQAGADPGDVRKAHLEPRPLVADLPRIATLALPDATDAHNLSQSARFISVRGSFARSWTQDLKDHKIHVNTISLGSVETPDLHGLAPNPDPWPQLRDYFESAIPLGHLGHADEIAKAATFLASGDATFVAGTELFVDGGQAQV